MSSAIPSLPSTKSNPELQNSENEEEDVGAVVVEENDISDDDAESFYNIIQDTLKKAK